MPKTRSTPLVESAKNFTIGLVTFATNTRIGAAINAIFSGLFIAIFFGTSSPNTSEKYDIIRVITTVENPPIIPIGITFTTGVFAIAPACISANDCAAVADVKNPAKVTPIWIVDKNELVFSVSF